MDEKKNEIRLIQMNKYMRPEIKEVNSKDWVLNGQHNYFYQYIIDRFNGSATNAAIINSYVDLVFGRGLHNLNKNIVDWIKFQKMISETEIKKIVSDFELYGEAAIQIIKAKGSGKLPILYHLPKENTAPKKVNEDNIIEGYYYSENWRKANVDNVEFLPTLGEGEAQNQVYAIRPYRAGKKYFSDPDYLAGLPYAELEEEVANYYVSHIRNGLSFGYIINIPDGNSYTPEEKDEIEKKIKQNLVGSSNAGKFVINFNGRDAEITVTSLENNDAHKQWEYLTGEARQQLLTAHRVTSPMLFGIKDNTGLGNNAEELDTAEAQLMKRVIRPKQKHITDALENIAAFYGLVLELNFMPIGVDEIASVDSSFTGVQISSAIDIIEKVNSGLIKPNQGRSLLRSMLSFPDKELDSVFNATNNTMSVNFKNAHPVMEFIGMGEDIDLELYDEVADDEVDYEAAEINFASTGTARPNAKSEQDSDDIIIRYRYVGDSSPEREFCKQMMRANKVYRKEDILQMGEKTVNPGFGMHPTPNKPYSIWLYKGGGLLSKEFPNGTCKHKWNRVIYLKKGVSVDVKSPLAEIISANKAKQKGFKVPVNNPRVGLTPHKMKI